MASIGSGLIGGISLDNTGPVQLGNWIPVIGGQGGTSGQTYLSNVGRCLRQGRLVQVWFSSQLTAKGTITGALVIDGLPFRSENIVNHRMGGMIYFYTNLSVNIAGPINLDLLGGQNIAVVRGTTTAGASTYPNFTTAEITDNTRFDGYLQYLTDEQ